jgi:hypothetical protein
MKIKIQEALDALLEDKRIDKTCNIEIENSYDYYPPDKPKLSWKIYATDAKNKKSSWSEKNQSFQKHLILLFRNSKKREVNNRLLKIKYFTRVTFGGGVMR